MTHESLQVERLWDEKEAADFLHVSLTTARRLRISGRLPYLRVGGQVRYDPSDLRAYLAKNRGTEGGR